MPSAHLFRAIPLSGKSAALLLSASLHAAVALAAVRGAPHASLNASLPEAPALELSPLELALTDPPVQPIQAPEPASVVASAPPARHHHDYAVPPDHDATVHDPELHHVLPLANAPAAAPIAPAPAPSVIDSPAPAAPRFVMTVGQSTRALAGSAAENGNGEASVSTGITTPVAETSVDTPAKLLVGGTPSYTREAEAAGVEADVPLELVVDAGGSVISARALAHVGYGLDDAALRSVRSYRFAPARRGGKALPVRMRWLMRFQLR